MNLISNFTLVCDKYVIVLRRRNLNGLIPSILIGEGDTCDPAGFGAVPHNRLQKSNPETRAEKKKGPVHDANLLAVTVE